MRLIVCTDCGKREKEVRIFERTENSGIGRNPSPNGSWRFKPYALNSYNTVAKLSNHQPWLDTGPFKLLLALGLKVGARTRSVCGGGGEPYWSAIIAYRGVTEVGEGVSDYFHSIYPDAEHTDPVKYEKGLTITRPHKRYTLSFSKLVILEWRQ